MPAIDTVTLFPKGEKMMGKDGKKREERERSGEERLFLKVGIAEQAQL